MVSSFPPSVISELKYYVYIYSHPQTEEVFYVGKGKGNRVFAHLDDISDSDKVAYLKSLREDGLDPVIEILIHGLELEDTALRVEAAVIDLIGRDKLTNRQKGYKSSSYGRLNIRQIVSLYQKSPVEVTHRAMAIRINTEYYPTITAGDLYDATRSYWKVNVARAKQAKYAFAVYHGIIYEVYQILDWYDGGQTFSNRQLVYAGDRKEFVGHIAPDPIRNYYLYKSISHYFKRGNANPIYYFNV